MREIIEHDGFMRFCSSTRFPLSLRLCVGPARKEGLCGKIRNGTNPKSALTSWSSKSVNSRQARSCDGQEMREEASALLMTVPL